MPPFIFLNFMNSPYGLLLVLVLVSLIIVGTLLVIQRTDLTSIQSIGLLLLVWLIPFVGPVAALAFLRLVPRR
ncbi:MAG: hypothetical protein ACJ8OJ_09535 [Povalibacter sp.]|jgi:uncharacterized membrane protein YGL010W